MVTIIAIYATAHQLARVSASRSIAHTIQPTNASLMNLLAALPLADDLSMLEQLFKMTGRISATLVFVLIQVKRLAPRLDVTKIHQKRNVTVLFVLKWFQNVPCCAKIVKLRRTLATPVLSRPVWINRNVS